MASPIYYLQNASHMKLTKFSLFRMPNTYKRFDYTPRHFDPDKEERDKRRKQLDAQHELGLDTDTKSISFRGGLRQNRSEFKTQALRTNIRIVLILGVLFMLVYYLFQKCDILGSLSGASVNQ